MTTIKILNGAVDTSKLATDAVTAAAILNKTITLGKFNQSGCGLNQIPKWNGTDWACASDAMSGPGAVTLAPASADADSSANPSIFINDTGGGNLLHLQTGGGSPTDRFVVSNAGLLTTASVGAAGIVAGAIDSTKLAVGAVDTDKLATDAVTTVKILNGALTRSKLNDSKFIVKTADQSVNASTVLVNDTDLKFPVLTGEVWAFEFVLMVANNSSAGPDWKAGVDAPAGSTGKVLQSGVEPVGAAFPQASTTDLTTPGTLVNGVIASDTGIDFNVNIQGFVVAGANGTVQLMWAQNTSTAVNLTVRRGSILRAYR